jgi:hypothetical protein
LQGVQQLLLCTTNVQVGVRLGLINDEEPERADKALIYESDSSSTKQGKSGSADEAEHAMLGGRSGEA